MADATSAMANLNIDEDASGLILTATKNTLLLAMSRRLTSFNKNRHSNLVQHLKDKRKNPDLSFHADILKPIADVYQPLFKEVFGEDIESHNNIWNTWGLSFKKIWEARDDKMYGKLKREWVDTVWEVYPNFSP